MPFEPLSYREAALATWQVDDINVTGDYTLTIAAGKKFVVYHLYIQAEGAAAAVTMNSGTTDISGPINIAQDTALELKNSGFPVFMGLAAGDDFVVDEAGSVQLNGFVVYSEVELTA